MRVWVVECFKAGWSLEHEDPRVDFLGVGATASAAAEIAVEFDPYEVRWVRAVEGEALDGESLAWQYRVRAAEVRP